MRSHVMCACALLLTVSTAFGQSYNLRVHLKSGSTITVPADSISRMAFSLATGIQDASTSGYAPTAFRLLQNYPNPFNPSTTIAYETISTSDVRLRIYDTRGALIRDLVHDAQSAGLHQVIWDGTDDGGAHVASGVYISVVQCGGQMLSRKMILMK